MAVTSSTRTASFAANGSTVSWSVGFPFDKAGDLVVRRVPAVGAPVVLTYPAGYTATPNAEGTGGTLTVATAYPSGDSVTVERMTAATQERAFASSNRLDVVQLERAVDRLTMARQDETSIWANALETTLQVGTDAGLAAAAAAASATAADGSADAAAGSATAAASSATAADASADAAAASETAAETAQAAAEAAQAAAEAAVTDGLANDSVTNAKLANVATATIKGRTTAGTGDPEDLSASAVRGLLNVADGATANDTDANLKNRANHTGTQAASTISDFATATAATAAVAANTAKVTNATHTGDVTGSGALTIAADAVTNAKLANVATATIKGRTTAGTGDPEDLSASAVRGLLNVADGATANDTDANLKNRANHTGTQAASTISDFASAVSGNSTVSGALQRSGGTMTGLLTVVGVAVASGSVSGTLTMAAHSGGVFTTSGNCTCPNTAGFSITLIAGGAHTVNVGTGAAVSLASGDMISIAIPAAGTVRAVKTLAADVLTMAVS